MYECFDICIKKHKHTEMHSAILSFIIISRWIFKRIDNKYKFFEISFNTKINFKFVENFVIKIMFLNSNASYLL